MRLPWSKPEQTPQPRRRGPYRKQTPQQKADELLARQWYRYLSEHPEYTMEIAKQKFGLPTDDGYEPAEAAPDLIQQIKNVRDARELFRGELGQPQSILGNVVAIVKEMPSILKEIPKAMEALQRQQQPQQYRQPVITEHVSQETRQLPEKEPEKSPEEALKDMAEAFLNMGPEVAANELWQFRDDQEDIRGIVCRYLDGKSVDQLMEYLPALQFIPQYQLLTPLADRLATKQGRIWLAVLIDELNKLNNIENQLNSDENLPNHNENNINLH